VELNEKLNSIWRACGRHPVWTGTVIYIVVALGKGLNATLGTDSRPAASFAIASPISGTTVSSPMQLRIAVAGAKIGQPSDGLDHLHVTVDDGDLQAIYYPAAPTVLLSSGQHTITVDLAGPDHQSLTPPQFVTFFVR
jgi:hypothetical protein